VATKITKIQVRRDLAESWTNANPTLSVGEIGFEQDSYRFKIGYGNLDWQNLPYFSGQGIIANTLAEVLDSGNLASDSDMITRGLKLENTIGADGKIEYGGISGDLIPAKSYFTSFRGVKQEVMNLEGSNLGDDNNRFKAGFFQGKDGKGTDFLVFGQETDGSDTKGTGTLSYIPQPIDEAYGIVEQVDELGRVQGVKITTDNLTTSGLLKGGEGYYVTTGVPARYTSPYDPDQGGIGGGRGLRVNITNVADLGGKVGTITENGITIQDSGNGYAVGEQFVVALNGKLILDAEMGDTDAGQGERSPLVTQKDLQDLSTQSIPVSVEERIQYTNPNAKTNAKLLPDPSFIENAEDFDIWTYRSLVQLEYLKPSVIDCVVQEPFNPYPEDPSGNAWLEQSNPVAVINTGVGRADALWGNYVGNKDLTGGEIIVWRPLLPSDPTNITGPNGAWAFAGASIEEDPYFHASESSHLSYVPNPLNKSSLTDADGVLVYAKPDNIVNSESRNDQTLMFMHNWTSVPTLS
jgi:hypothetical protein